MITENYVSFEIAKLLKEKGFDENTHSYYISDNEISYIGITKRFNSESTFLSAPTHQMTLKWLREKYKIQVEITIVGYEPWENPTKWYYGWRCQNVDIIDRINADYISYEEATESAIKHCLKSYLV